MSRLLDEDTIYPSVLLLLFYPFVSFSQAESCNESGSEETIKSSINLDQSLATSQAQKVTTD